MNLVTQVIGKTSAVKGGLFRIKERLLFLGVKVRHPLADHIITTLDGKAYTYNPTQWSRYEILLNVAESIKDCDLHIVSNDIGGIIGREASLSLVYAMTQNKPIIITHKPYFRPNVDKRWIDIIRRNKKELQTQNLLRLNNADLKTCIELITAQHPHYKLTPQEKTDIQRAIRDALRLSLN